jgi:nitrite reductase (NO-forming)
MNQRRLAIIMILVAVLMAGFVIYIKREPLVATNKNNTPSAPKVTTLGSLIQPAEPNQKTVEVTVTATDGKLSPSNLTVPAGARVLLTLVNLGKEYHNLTLMGRYLQTATPTIAPSQQIVLSFTPSQAETITYYCSIDDHKKLGEKGTLVIQ